MRLENEIWKLGVFGDFCQNSCSGTRGQLPNGSRQVYEKVEQGNRDSRMLGESLCNVMEGAWADSSRDPDSNPNLLLAGCVTLGILLHLWTSSGKWG